MKYTYESAKYALKNFLYVFPFAILPAFFLSISTDEGAIIRIVEALFNGDLTAWNFADLFLAISVLNFGSWQSVVSGVIGIVISVPCMALLMALLEKHFRIGKRTFNGVWQKLNDNFISTFGYVFLLLFLYEIWAVLTAAVLDLLAFININLIAYPLIIVFFLIMHVLLLWVIVSIYLWTPCMQITGFRSFEALQYSYQLVMPIRWRIILPQMCTVMVAESLIGLCAMYLSNALVFDLLTTALYLVMIMIFCVRMQIVYFERDHIERADLRKY